MVDNLKLLNNVKELKSNEGTVKLFEMLLDKAIKGEVTGGVVIAIDSEGEVQHWVRAESKARMADVVCALRTTEHSLLHSFVYGKE